MAGLTSSEKGGRVQVVRVDRRAPAADAGLRPGDFVLAVDGRRVASLEEFYKKVWDCASLQDEVKLTVLQGALRRITLKLVDRITTMTKPAGI